MQHFQCSDFAAQNEWTMSRDKSIYWRTDAVQFTDTQTNTHGIYRMTRTQMWIYMFELNISLSLPLYLYFQFLACRSSSLGSGSASLQTYCIFAQREMIEKYGRMRDEKCVVLCQRNSVAFSHRIVFLCGAMCCEWVHCISTFATILDHSHYTNFIKNRV